MTEQIKVPGVLRPGTGDYHSYAKDIIDDQLRNKKQSELNAIFNQGKGIDKNGNIVPIAGGEAIDADDISYTEKVSPDSHKTGSVGKKVKELENRINDLVPGEEYVSDTVIDLIDYMLNENTPQSFTYDSDTKYVYSGKVTTMCTYSRNNISYAAFKVVDIDKYIAYTIYDNTFTYYNEFNSETLPNEARSKFELGKYALVKQLEGKTGDSWVDGKVGVFVDSSNRPMSFRYVSSVEIYGQTLNDVLLGKTADGTNIYVYNLSSGLFKFNNRISSNDSAFEALNTLVIGASGGNSTNNYEDLINKPIVKNDNEKGYVINGGSNKAPTKGSFAFGNGAEASGLDSFAFGYFAKALGNYSYAGGYYNQALGDYSCAEGNSTVAEGQRSHSEGWSSYAIGNTSHAEGNAISYGSLSHAEGNKELASATKITRVYSGGTRTVYVAIEVPYGAYVNAGAGQASVFVENCFFDANNNDYKLTLSASLYSNDIPVNGTVAVCGAAYGENSHAEGLGTISSGNNSHAEGRRTVAQGIASHAEGDQTIAKGWGAHAEGVGTIAYNSSEHAAGEYNISTLSYTKQSFGIGSAAQRKNAYEVDYEGKFYIKGIGGYDGTNYGATGVKSVQEVITSLLSALT